MIQWKLPVLKYKKNIIFFYKCKSRIRIDILTINKASFKINNSIFISNLRAFVINPHCDI